MLFSHLLTFFNINRPKLVKPLITFSMAIMLDSQRLVFYLKIVESTPPKSDDNILGVITLSFK